MTSISGGLFSVLEEHGMKIDVSIFLPVLSSARAVSVEGQGGLEKKKTITVIDALKNEECIRRTMK